MKRAAIAFTAAFLLSGCTVSPLTPAKTTTVTSTPPPTVTVTQTPSSSSSATSTTSSSTATAKADPKTYLRTLRQELAGTELGVGSNSSLLSLGKSICAALDRGASKKELRSAGKGNIGGAAVGVVTDAATLYLCPKYA